MIMHIIMMYTKHVYIYIIYIYANTGICIHEEEFEGKSLVWETLAAINHPKFYIIGLAMHYIRSQVQDLCYYHIFNHGQS